MTTPEYAELARLGVSTVYEAAGRRGLLDHEWRQVVPGSRACGPARTALCATGDNRAVHEAVASLRPGEVLVLAMEDPQPFGIIGDLLVTQMEYAGCAGVVVDSGVRDVEELARMSVPVWTRWVRSRGATKEHRGAIDAPVTIGGVTVAPGDAVVLDSDGVVAVEQERVGTVVEAARDREIRERRAREDYRSGVLSYDRHGLRAYDEALS
ncbi:4-carboxy-4-hydroxy-2-oxoadipate aldolase/oxaloacetate decarboxylase [Aeromicrobium sp. CTD01-1L150]|uniref:4-carboxy-4-hydroxy-2-oxoadipate aldolase/oxaloacetate decarboxylase n=1 Tax=Aeromicrobium sp. CTD01-1L150 TaxID=3341830 RepID=UPI0035BEDD6D